MHNNNLMLIIMEEEPAAPATIPASTDASGLHA